MSTPMKLTPFEIAAIKLGKRDGMPNNRSAYEHAKARLERLPHVTKPEFIAAVARDDAWAALDALNSERTKAAAIVSAIRTALSVSMAGIADLDAQEWWKLIPEKLRQLAAEYEPAHGNVVICGATGVGKSVACAWICRRLVTAKAQRASEWMLRDSAMPREFVTPTAYMMRASALSQAARQHPLGSGEAPLIRDAKEVALLIIDDLGWEPERDDTIRDVIACRYDEGRPLITTTGLTPDELTARYTAPVVRRLTRNKHQAGKKFELFT